MPQYLWYIFVAFGLYSWAVWGAHFNKDSLSFFRFIFVLAFVFDLIGTHGMYLLRTKLDLHGLIGFLALVIMGIHAVWALGSLSYEYLEELFHRWSPWAWGLWVLTFISGAIFHFPK